MKKLLLICALLVASIAAYAQFPEIIEVEPRAAEVVDSGVTTFDILYWANVVWAIWLIILSVEVFSNLNKIEKNSRKNGERLDAIIRLLEDRNRSTNDQ